MKFKFAAAPLMLALVCAGLFWFSDSLFQVEANAMVSPNLVISQFQTRGASNQEDEFIELHNTGPDPVDLNGFKVVYRSAGGVNDVGPMAQWNTSTIIPAGGYYLIATNTYDGPATPDITYTPSVCSCSISGNGGGLAVRNAEGVILDSVGWGTATNAFIETAVTAAPPADTGQSRKNNACQDTDNNLDDFENLNPAGPRNSSTPINTCSGGGTNLFATIGANPSFVSPGASTLITVTVIPATVPPSTGITVVGDLTDIGGNASQTFFDDGTNGDQTAGDNVFSYSAAIPVEIEGGVHNVTAVAADAESRSVNLNQAITINAPLPGDDPTLFGIPSNATADIANENDYLMYKPQYTLSYNRSKATANWVAWRLDSSWIGGAQRQDDYRPDASLPAGWYQVQNSDYSGSGYNRGHMCPSGDRTNSVENNSATFLMTNMVPQISENNQGPWEEFETYCRSLAAQGNEIYIYSGPAGNIGTIAQGRIVVPAYTWKVVIIMPNGTNDLERFGRSTRAFGIIVPNTLPLNINAPWREFRVPINTVENLTGYDFLTNVGRNTAELVERKRDMQ